MVSRNGVSEFDLHGSARSYFRLEHIVFFCPFASEKFPPRLGGEEGLKPNATSTVGGGERVTALCSDGLMETEAEPRTDLATNSTTTHTSYGEPLTDHPWRD